MENFEKLIRTNARIYRSKDADVITELKQRKKAAKANNSDLRPCYDEHYKCLTCGTKGQNHPLTGYCFICDTDNWEQVNN